MIDHLKPISAITCSGILWIADTATAGIQTGLSWVDKYGLAIVFLAVCIYAISVQFKSNQAAHNELVKRAESAAALQEKTADALQNNALQNFQVAAALERVTSAMNRLEAASSNRQTHNPPTS
jgi:hypothetical protein